MSSRNVFSILALWFVRFPPQYDISNAAYLFYVYRLSPFPTAGHYMTNQNPVLRHTLNPSRNCNVQWPNIPIGDLVETWRIAQQPQLACEAL